MILEKAQVTNVDGDKVTVSAQIKTTCNACQAQADCGTGVIANAFVNKHQTISLTSPVPVKVGDVVTIGLPEARVLSASFWLYLLPLLVLIGGMLSLNSLFSHFGFGHELLAFSGAIVLTFGCFIWVSGHLKSKDNRHFQPVIIPPSK